MPIILFQESPEQNNRKPDLWRLVISHTVEQFFQLLYEKSIKKLQSVFVFACFGDRRRVQKNEKCLFDLICNQFHKKRANHPDFRFGLISV